MIQVIDGDIKQYSLPKVGTLSDGTTVSGYHLLDVEILKAEGWLPLEDNPPTYNSETEYLIQDGYEILEDKVKKKYKIELIPEEKPNEFQLFKMAVISTFEKLIKIDDLTEEE
ncbi:MAG TPA: hypothetical protein VFC79_09835, partial [Tissierellaceae bacterium]|nr:hypothetical protein [Tissierellaceae bacterium]